MRNKLVVALLAFLVALPLCGSGGRRRVERPAVLLVEGTINAVTSTSISIRTPEGPSMTITITASTKIERGMADVATASLQNGNYITARVEQLPGGTLTALEIHLHSAPPAAGGTETVRIAGTVISAGTLTLQLKTEKGPITVNADATTVIRRAGETIPFEAIKAGDNAVVAGKIVNDATVFALAIEILLEPVPPPVPPIPSIYGQVSTVGANQLTVVVNPPDPRMGMPTRIVTVRVDAKTVIQKNGEAVPLTSIHEGDFVLAYGTFGDDQIMLAAKIDVVDQKPAGEVRGKVVGISGNDIAVEADTATPMPATMPPAPRVVVRVSASTEIWRDAARAQLTDIHAGDFIAAAGDWVDGTTLAAKKIAILPPPLVRVSGNVVTVGDHTLQVRAMAPSPDSGMVEIRTDGKTAIFADGIEIPFEAIKAGDSLTAIGTQLADGAILAQRIDVSRVPVPSWISGIVREVHGNDIAVDPGMASPPGVASSVIVRVDEKTTIVRDGRIVTIADVKTGDRLEGAGIWIGDGVLLAAKISLSTDVPPVMELFARVTSISGFDLTVEPAVGMMDTRPGYPSMIVHATAATVVTDHGAAASFSSIVIGSYIHVTGEPSKDGTIAATAIDVTDAPPPPMTVIEGTVVEVREQEFVVAFPSFAYPSVKATVRITPTTLITKNGAVIALSELKPADQVSAAGTWLSEGIFVAEKVAVRSFETPPLPPPVTVGGEVSRIEGGTVWIRGDRATTAEIALVIGDDTKIVRNGSPAELSQVRAGDMAKAAGWWDAPGRLKAAFIEVMSPRM